MNAKKLLSFLTAVAMATGITAHVSPIVLGDSHAMLKITENSRYLLIPIQETEDIGKIYTIIP